MHGSRGEGPPWFTTRAFSDADDLVRALHGTGVEYIPLAAGAYRTRLTVARFGGVTLQRVADRAHVTRGALDPGVVALLFPIRQAAPATVRGCSVAESEGLLLGEGAELHALCPGDLDWAALSMRPALAAELAELGGLGAAAIRPGGAARLPAATLAPLRQAVAAATDAMAALPPGAAAPRMTLALAAGLGETLRTAFAAADDSAAPRATRDAIRLVDTAEAMLRAAPGRCPQTEQLCAALGVSARTLHKAFVAATGMSPQAYLRRRRLMMVHAALKDGGGDAGLVKSVALEHGFWHLGHFARSYREQFGQMPSETLARASAGTYRRAIPRAPAVAGERPRVEMG